MNDKESDRVIEETRYKRSMVNSKNSEREIQSHH